MRLQEFPLGHELLTYAPPMVHQSFDYSPETIVCFLLYSGRIRLLCQNTYLQRRVSIGVLEGGDIFGGDHLFCSNPLPYQAIAASRCEIMPISYQMLTDWLEKNSWLQEHLAQVARQREQLIFFKQFTSMGSTPSQTLRQVLLPRLVEQRVGEGCEIADATPMDEGYFWLRSGRISHHSDPAKSPTIGHRWGYADPVAEEWVAQTDLVVYQQRINPWESATCLHGR